MEGRGKWSERLVRDRGEGSDPRFVATAQDSFSQHFFRSHINLELSSEEAIQHWQALMRHRAELTKRLSRPISFKTALMDYVETTGLMRNPVIIEEEELASLVREAGTDPLSGFFNRRLFEQIFAKECTRAHRYGYPLILTLMDLRHFKEVNDRYGHLKGDTILRSLGATVRLNIRTSDYAFRLGGDEFAILLPHTDMQQGETLVRRVIHAFAHNHQSLADTMGLNLDVGLATYPVDGSTMDEVYQQADQRLYAEKHRGRTLRGKQKKRADAHLRERDSRTPASRPNPGGKDVDHHGCA